MSFGEDYHQSEKTVLIITLNHVFMWPGSPHHFLGNDILIILYWLIILHIIVLTNIARKELLHHPDAE